MVGSELGEGPRKTGCKRRPDPRQAGKRRRADRRAATDGHGPETV